jgi:hypothetical protein
MILIEHKIGRIYLDATRRGREYSRTLVFPATPTIYAEVAVSVLGQEQAIGWVIAGGVTEIMKENGEIITFPRRGIVRATNARAVTFHFVASNASVTFHYSVSRWEPNPTPVG